MKTGLACLGLAVVTIAAIVAASVMNGWVLSILWGWFITPVFTVPSLSVVQAMGFGLVITMLTYRSSSTDTKTGDKDWTDLVASLLSAAVMTPLFYLFVGWVIYQFA